MKSTFTVKEHSKRSYTSKGRDYVDHQAVLLEEGQDALTQFVEFQLDEEQAKAYPDGSLVGKRIEAAITNVVSVFNGRPRVRGKIFAAK